MQTLTVSPSPHDRGTLSTTKIMLAVLIALLPACISGCMLFGMRALVLLAVCTASAVVFEALCRIIMKREQTISDLSAAVTGLLLGMNLPVDLPIWQAVVGSFLAIVVVKQLFGGLGQNFANPAITARIMLMLSFSEMTSVWRMPQSDAIAAATPLVSGDASYWDLLLGNTAGCIGETSAAALMLGGIALCIAGIIHPVTPLAFISTVALGSWMCGDNPLYQILAGGLMLGAWFMATDYVTTPITVKGKLIFGIGCGIITVVIRQFGGYPEGVSFSILLMNLVTPYIDRFTMQKPFGAMPAKKQEEQAHA